MTAANPAPVDGAEEQPGGPPDAAESAQPTAKRREETIEIHGYGKVPTSEVAKHFDPDCPRRCDSGSRKAGRPFLGRVVYVRELCDCAVGGYIAAHPLQDDAPAIVAGAVARAAAAGVPRAAASAQNPRGEQVRRLRTRIDELKRDLGAIHADVGERLAPLCDDIAAAESLAARTDGALASLQGELAGVRDRIAALVAREAELVRQVTDADVASSTARRALSERQAQAADIRGSRSSEERHITKQIERVERRIAAIVLRHPEAARG